MKKIFPFSLAVLCMTAIACKKSADNPSKPVDPEVFPEIDIAVSGLPHGPAGNIIQGNGKFNLLGYGYDITGKYADSSAVRGRAIDVPGFDAAMPGRCVVQFARSGSFRTVDGENAEAFAQRLSNRLKTTAGTRSFRGAIADFFPEQTAFSGKYVYGDFEQIIQYKQAKMMGLYPLLQQFLTPAFTSDIQLLPAAELVKKYGTHVLSNVLLGAKFHVVYQAETQAANRKAALQAGFSVAMNKVFGLFPGSLDLVTAAVYKTIASPKVVYHAIGGDLSKLSENKTVKPTRVDMVNWSHSNTEEGALFIDIGDDGLIPLYELVTDTAKKQALKSYMDTYLEKQQVKLID